MSAILWLNFAFYLFKKIKKFTSSGAVFFFFFDPFQGDCESMCGQLVCPSHCPHESFHFPLFLMRKLTFLMRTDKADLML